MGQQFYTNFRMKKHPEVYVAKNVPEKKEPEAVRRYQEKLKKLEEQKKRLEEEKAKQAKSNGKKK
jgi:tRNA A22 N-methylase